MNRRVVLLNLALLCMTGILVWQLRLRRAEAAAQQKVTLDKQAHAQAVLAPPVPAPSKPIVPAEYVDTAQKMLFSKDRNPNVIVEVPPPPPPPPPPPVMPALPFYYGQLHFGGPAVIELRAANGKEQKGYEAGEKIGDFKIVSFDSDTVTFEWNGENVVRKVAELRPKDDKGPQQAAVAPPPAAAAKPAASGVISLGGAAADASNPASSIPSVVGPDVGGGFFGCKPGDTTPSGTTINGYRKTSTTGGIMGGSCRWERLN